MFVNVLQNKKQIDTIGRGEIIKLITIRTKIL